MTEPITSTANPLVKRIRKLEHRKFRDREHQAFVQGIQAVRQSVEAGIRPECIVVAPDLLKAQSVTEFLADCRRLNVPVHHVTSAIFATLVGASRPSGLGAIVPITRPSLDSWTLPDGPITLVVVDRAANPGNLGTIIRTANATGTAAVVLVGPSADPWDPQALKAAMGATFATPVLYTASLEELVTWSHAHHVALVATSGYASTDVWDSAWPPRHAIVMGSEQHGLPPEFLAQADARVRLPMTGTAESLNLAVATGILLYETVRRAR